MASTHSVTARACRHRPICQYERGDWKSSSSRSRSIVTEENEGENINNCLVVEVGSNAVIDQKISRNVGFRYRILEILRSDLLKHEAGSPS